MAMPKSTPRRPVNPGQNRDSRDGVFGHPESQVGPLPRVGPLRPRFDTASAHDQDAAAAAARVPGTPSLAGGPRCRRGRLRIQAAPGERPSTRRCAAARDRHHRGVAAGLLGPLAQRPDAHSPRTPRARRRLRVAHRGVRLDHVDRPRHGGDGGGLRGVRARDPPRASPGRDRAGAARAELTDFGTSGLA